MNDNKKPDASKPDEKKSGTAKQIYKVQWHLRRGGKPHQPGDEIELTAAEAAKLGAVVKRK